MGGKKNILICPLNWGLGHAARDIPIIRELLSQNFNVIIGGNGHAIDLLKGYFPDLQYVKIYSPQLYYGRKNSFSIKFYIYFVRYMFSALVEHFAVKKIIKKYDISVIISDNRFGLWNKKIKSIFVTHQLNAYLNHRHSKKSIISSFVNTLIINKYDLCLVPDFEDKNLSLAGRLSRNENIKNAKYIGIMSRFEKKIPFDKENKKYDYLCILSGPEPQRSLLEEILIQKFKDFKVLIIRGLPQNTSQKENTPNITFLNNCSDKELQEYFSVSAQIICRSGYTSLLDLFAIGRKAILVPTPNQPEQEYLAKRMNEKFDFEIIKQEDIINGELRSNRRQK